MQTNEVFQGYPGRKGKFGRFSKPVILEIVKQVEKGISRSEIVERYKISRSTIAEWMRDYGSPDYHASKQAHVSHANKTSVLRAVLDERMTVLEAMIAYRVSSSTIHGWVRKYKREKGELRAIMPNKTTSSDGQPGEPEELEALRKELQKVQQALNEEKLKVQALNTLIDVAEDKLKISIRKKAGAKRS